MTSGTAIASVAPLASRCGDDARNPRDRGVPENAASTLIVGLGGAARHSCVALCANQRIVAACEQERVTRVGAAGPNRSGLPDEALDLVLERRHRRREHIQRVALAETFEGLTTSDEDVRLDHHEAHAAAAFLTSPFADATIVVVDDTPPGVSVWTGNGGTLSRVDWPWCGDGLAALYVGSTRALGIDAFAHSSHVEAMARLAPDARDSRIDALFATAPDRILTAPHWQAELERRRGTLLPESGALHGLAASVQGRLGDLLLEILAAVRRVTGATRLCLAGSFFYNTYFCALAKRSPSFDDVFVPINPGDAGLAVGNALHAAGTAARCVSPYLGPAFSSEEVKRTLDNCKVPYEWVGESEAIERAVSALMRGYLVGWFDGPMEWGPRALGGRSILASPSSPYVLENLNRFLKHRPSWRSYALSGLAAYVHDAFEGPDASPYMECDYRARDGDLVRYVLPCARASVRIQTVGEETPLRFRQLLAAFGDRTGVPMLVNTSFNGFSEPIVCNPRDAVRVFYGTGLDMLVIDRFVLAK